MNQKKNFLKIQINYRNSIYEINKEELNYAEIKKEVMEHFKINKEKEDYLVFIYEDEDGEKNILEHNENEIFEVSQKLNDEYFLLKLDLIIGKYKNKKPDENKEINYFEEKKEQNNNIKDENNNLYYKERKESVDEVKKVFNDKLKLINKLVNDQIKSMQNDVLKLINNKYKIIENELSKVGLNIKSNELDNKKNNNDIQKEKNIIQDNQKNNNTRFSIISQNEEIFLEPEKNNKEYVLISKSQINLNNILNENNSKNIINEKKELNDFENIDNFDKEESYNNKDDGMHGSGGGFFSFLQKNNKKENKTKEIKDKIFSIYQKDPITYEDFIKIGNNIFSIMNKNNLDISKINNYIKNEIYENEKNKDMSENDKKIYYKILLKVNHFIKIQKCKQIMDNFFENEIFKKKDKIKKDIDVKSLFVSLNNTEYQNQFIDYLKKTFLY